MGKIKASNKKNLTNPRPDAQQAKYGANHNPKAGNHPSPQLINRALPKVDTPSFNSQMQQRRIKV
jgi:hypothetical protein